MFLTGSEHRHKAPPVRSIGDISFAAKTSKKRGYSVSVIAI
jgi:hypothetical protein